MVRRASLSVVAMFQNRRPTVGVKGHPVQFAARLWNYCAAQENCNRGNIWIDRPLNDERGEEGGREGGVGNEGEGRSGGGRREVVGGKLMEKRKRRGSKRKVGWERREERGKKKKKKKRGGGGGGGGGGGMKEKIKS